MAAKPVAGGDKAASAKKEPSASTIAAAKAKAKEQKLARAKLAPAGKVHAGKGR